MGANDQGAQYTEGRWLTVNRTLCFLRYQDDVLLLRRSQNARIFPGRYNGVGGHVERGEDPLTCARREIREETGLPVRDLSLKALYAIDAGDASGVMVYVFIGKADTRQFIDSDEGKLQWVPAAQVGSYPLVDDLYELLPRLLEMPLHAEPLFIQMRYNDADKLVLEIVE